MEMTMNYELITPEKAKEYLSTMVNNRTLSKATVKAYVTDMENGNWDEKVGTAISFDENGHLIDGQHRLSALVSAKVNLHMWVFRGGKSGAIYDSNRKRSNSDQVAILRGDLEAIYRKPYVHSIFKRIIEDKKDSDGHWARITAKEIIDIIDDNRELLDGYFLRIPHTTVTNITIATVHYALFSAYCARESMDKLIDFFEILCTGKSIGEDAFPVIALRNYLLQRMPRRLDRKQDVWRCQWAIKQYINGKTSFITKEPKKPIYPIPDLKIRRYEGVKMP